MPKRTWSFHDFTRSLSGKLSIASSCGRDKATAAASEQVKAVELLNCDNLDDCLNKSHIWQSWGNSAVKMPKKSNAFDYTNRSSTGVKLGDIIAKDVVKEATNAEKVVQRARRKVSVGNAEHSSVQTLDIKAPGKDLSDDGVFALAAGIEAALKAGTTAGSLALEDLNLQDNGLTTAALARLAPVIHLARLELKTLVLSGNRIRVTNDKEATQWETFLLAFKDCKRLRRLDLSGNVELGARAFEIFTRVHTNEPAITPVALGGDRETLTLAEGRDTEDETASVKGRASTDFGSEMDPMAAATFIPRRSGLRSIPYIDLQDTGLDDSGALWFSYTLEDHYYPNRLITELNAPPATTTIEIYQQDTAEGGILWRGNELSLGRDGLRLITKTEAVRKQASLGDNASIQTEDSEYSMIHMAGTRVPSRGSAGNRRTSVRSVRPEDGGEREMSELDSMRKHVQRAVIDKNIQRKIFNTQAAVKETLPTIELWKTAEGLIHFSRMILLLVVKADVRKLYTGRCLFVRRNSIEPTPDPKIERQDSISGDFGIVPVLRSNSHENIVTPTSTLNRMTGTSYAATLSAKNRNFSSVQLSSAITDVTNTSTPQKMTFRPHRRSTASGDSDELQFITRSVAALPITLRDTRPERFLEYQDKYIEKHGASYFRDTSVACQLPTHIFERIARHPGDANCNADRRDFPTHILSAEQQAACYRWGQDKETLNQAREWMRRDESAQKWMLLDGVRCLAYGS